MYVLYESKKTYRLNKVDDASTFSALHNGQIPRANFTFKLLS